MHTLVLAIRRAPLILSRLLPVETSSLSLIFSAVKTSFLSPHSHPRYFIMFSLSHQHPIPVSTPLSKTSNHSLISDKQRIIYTSGPQILGPLLGTHMISLGHMLGMHIIIEPLPGIHCTYVHNRYPRGYNQLFTETVLTI